MLFSSPNIASASAFESSVLPTPVGPRNMKLPIGLLGSLIPTLARLTALAIDFTASFCHTTLLWSISSRCSNFSLSDSVSFSIGILVHTDTTLAIFSLSTTKTCLEL